MSQETVKRTVLRSDEFTCPSCVAKIENKLNRLDGVEEAKVHFATGRIEVGHDRTKTSVEDLVGAVKEAGYKAEARAF
ncbi:MAG: heavy-metal-associated domain-containing protein [Solirubrobacterales bacterium]|nr:heavy-metal-associated domain-containing protein [Solirubrobacterales bacterium]